MLQVDLGMCFIYIYIYIYINIFINIIFIYHLIKTIYGRKKKVKIKLITVN